MAITVDPLTYVINIPRGDLSLVQITPTEIRTMDLNWFRMQLHDLMDDEYGMPLPKMFTHNTEVLLGGITYARILEILDPYSVTFEDGQYAVNLTGANSNVADKTNVNQVSVRPQNSAGLISSADIEYGSFNGGVSFDEINGYSGTGQISNGANIGSPRAPSNNMWDTEFIASYRGFDTIYVNGDITIPEYERDGITPFTLSDFSFVGSGKSVTEIFIPEISDMQTCKYYDSHISGTLDGFNTLLNCYIDDLYYIKGYLESCVLSPGVITLGGNDTAHFLDCYSGVPGIGTPTIDFGGSGQALAMRNYNGGILLTNKTGTESVSIDLNSGQVQIDLSTVINGTIVIRGIGKVIESTTGDDLPTGFYGNLYIFNEAMNRDNISSAVWDEPIADHLISGTTGLSVGISQFNDAINIDVSGSAGTEFPLGTAETPVNNIDDAIIIAENNGIDALEFKNDFTISGGAYSKYIFIGRGRQSPTLTFVDVEMIGCQFEDVKITGSFINNSQIGLKNCYLEDIDDITLTAQNCVLNGTINLNSGMTNLYQCFDGVPGVGKPIINLNSCTDFGIWGYRGAIALYNIETPDTVISYMVDQGRLFVDETCTEGLIIIKGSADIWGETNGTSIDQEGLVTKRSFSEAVLNSDITIHQHIDTVGHIFMQIAYGDRVFVDTTSINTGNRYPIGTQSTPVNNITEAIEIASYYNCKELHLHSNADFDDTHDISHLTIKGHTQIPYVTFTDVVSSSSSFDSIYMTGNVIGRANYYGCHINNMTGVSGFVDECQLQGDIYLNNVTSNETIMNQCSSVDLAGPRLHTGTETLIVAQMSGRMTIHDLIDGVIGLGGDFCQFILDASCTGGTAAIGTKGLIINNSNGTVVALENSLTSEVIAAEVWNNLTGAQVSTDIEFIKQIEGGRWKIENNQMTFYEDDNITIIATFDLKNSAGAPTETEVYERERV